jgi:galactose mutarotase-like enzyme
MSPVSVARTTTEGFPSIHVQTGTIELILIPELGGKISSLRDVRNGREWLWRHPRFAYQHVPSGGSYVETADTGGWDECFPSVAACAYPSAPWQGVAIQDHGEVWSQRAESEIDAEEKRVTLRTRSQGIALPYTFSRSITLTANSSIIRTNYEVVNNADQSEKFIWCIHPLIAIKPAMELRLPSSVRFNLGAAFPSDLLSQQNNLQYPFSARGLNFPFLPETTAGCSIKIWSDPLQVGEGWATLRATDGELQMRWDVNLLPQVALWMNFGAWAGDGGAPYYNMGLEPCIGAQDSLADAVNLHNLFGTLPPRGRKSWWLEIELTA